jgi:hypothetical protein
MKLMNIFFGQNAEVFNFKSGASYSLECPTVVLQLYSL